MVFVVDVVVEVVAIVVVFDFVVVVVVDVVAEIVTIVVVFDFVVVVVVVVGVAVEVVAMVVVDVEDSQAAVEVMLSC